MQCYKQQLTMIFIWLGNAPFEGTGHKGAKVPNRFNSPVCAYQSLSNGAFVHDLQTRAHLARSPDAQKEKMLS